MHRVHIPKEVPDNDLQYFDLIFATVDYSSPKSRITVNNSDGLYKIVVQPSTEGFKQSIIDNLLSLHRNLKIKIRFSKSLKISKNIYFEVNLG